MNKLKKIVLLTTGLVAATVTSAYAQVVPSLPDMADNIEDAQTSITAVLTVVAGTAAFYIGLRIFKWVAKR